VRAESDPARFRVDPVEAQRIAERFVAAATSGDLNALMQVLDPNVVGHADSGGLAPAARRPIVGRNNVAKGILGFQRDAHLTLVPMPVNGEPGVLSFRDGRLAAVVALSVRDGLIAHIHAIVNPDKLAYAASLLGVPTDTGAGASTGVGNRQNGGSMGRTETRQGRRTSADRVVVHLPESTG
jgi:RNA polymerase sigma-70 factor (ECF subfamily)